MWLSGTKVTGSGLKHLVGLPKLRILRLENTPLGDNAVAGLAGLKVLKSLDLEGSKVTAEGLARLQAARPDLAIIEP